MSEHDKSTEQQKAAKAADKVDNDLMDEDDIAALLEQNQPTPSDTSEPTQATSPAQEQSDIDDILADAQPPSSSTDAAMGEQNQQDPQDISWPLPDFTEPENKQQQPASNAYNMKPAWFYEAPEEEEPEIEFEPMTIEELEALRQSAYEEGKAEGIAAGHEEGLAKGIEDGLEQGKQQGHQEGLAQGLSEGQQQIDELAGRWAGLIGQLHQPCQQLDQEVEQQVVELAMKLAAEIVQVELVTNPKVIVHTVKQAVAALPLQNQHIRIHLHPDDMAIVQSVFPPETQQKKQWQLLADGSLTPGDCLIENELSSVSVDMSDVIKQSLQSFIRQNGQDDDAEPTT